MPAASATHLVLIPSYNTGDTVYKTVAAARAQWNPVWVVVDGSTDGSADWLTEEAAGDPGLRVLVLPGMATLTPGKITHGKPPSAGGRAWMS